MVYFGQHFTQLAKTARAGLIICSCFLSACAGLPAQRDSVAVASGENVQGAANESLLKTARNYPALIQFYKKQLEVAGTLEQKDRFSFLLAQAYLNAGDSDSAIFYIDPVIQAGRDSYELFLLKSKALLVKGDLKGALRTAVTAEGYGKKDAAIYNQLGLVCASLGDFRQSRLNFSKARYMMMDDATIQNNIAMLDLLEGKYSDAVDRLMSLFQTRQADEKVKANLLFALAKAGRFQEFEAVYGPGYSEQEYLSFFQELALVKARNSAADSSH